MNQLSLVDEDENENLNQTVSIGLKLDKLNTFEDEFNESEASARASMHDRKVLMQ